MTHVADLCVNVYSCTAQPNSRSKARAPASYAYYHVLVCILVVHDVFGCGIYSSGMCCGLGVHVRNGSQKRMRGVGVEGGRLLENPSPP